MWVDILIWWIIFLTASCIGYAIFCFFRGVKRFLRWVIKGNGGILYDVQAPSTPIASTRCDLHDAEYTEVTSYTSVNVSTVNVSTEPKEPIVTPPPATEPTPTPASKDRPREVKYEPIFIKSDMVFKWQYVDDNECRLIFYPNELLESLDFQLEKDYFKYRENRIYEISPTSDEDTLLKYIYVWAEREEYDYYGYIKKCTKKVNINTPEQYKGINGVFKFNENLQYPYKVRKDDHLMTLYFREKADIKRLEQKQLDEIAEEERRQKALEEEKAEIAAKIKAKYRKQQLEKIVRQELVDNGELFGEQAKRPRIPREVVDAVYSRDGGRCVYCGSTDNLQLDHIIPFSRGGATNVDNLQLLCQKCNLEKSNKIG